VSGADGKVAKTEVLIGLGANLGRPAEQLRRAVEALARVLNPMRLSSLYRSAPVGYADQPDFYNLACRGETGLGALDLLAELQRIEEAAGRQRSFANAPRTLDLDLLAVGDRVIRTTELTVPHPRLHQRAFVLVPLLEVAPGWRHPELGLDVAAMLRAAGSAGAVERVGELFGD
jgi:2-amino-4-hydroxy-6-hydroxymethyldihydropteridine diphosphokinase